MPDMQTKDHSYSNPPPNADAGFAGTLKNIQLTDLIQMCCLSTSSLCMRVTKDGRRGTIFIIDGEIVHAVCENMEGEEAFYGFWVGRPEASSLSKYRRFRHGPSSKTTSF